MSSTISEQRPETVSIDTWDAYLGIVLGGGFYAFLASVGMCVLIIGIAFFARIVGTSPWPTVASFVSWLGLIVASISVSWIIGLLIAAILALFALLFVTVFNATMGSPISASGAGGLAAGMTGFVIPGIVAMSMIYESPNATTISLSLLCGPLLCMLCCQVLADYQTEKFRLIRETGFADVQIARYPDLPTRNKAADWSFQLSVRSMFVLTAWLAAFAALVKALENSGFSTWYTAAFVGTYIVLQAISIAATRLIRPLLKGRLKNSVEFYQTAWIYQQQSAHPDPIDDTVWPAEL